MKFAPLAFLLASAGTFYSATAAVDQCPEKPVPVRDIKFFDKDGDQIHNYELRGQARIVEPAPDGIPRGLRIDKKYAFALLKGLDISPSKMRDCTMTIGAYIESIKDANNPNNPNQKKAYGWVMSHDNGGYDRAIFMHDERFNGMGMSVGKAFPANDEPMMPPLKQWIQIAAVWRDGGECELYIDAQKKEFSQPIIGQNKEGRPDLAIGAPEQRNYGKENDNDLWIKEVKVFDYALEEEEIDAMYCHFEEEKEPTVDCGFGQDLVYSCTECPDRIGEAAGCGGVCQWRPEIPHCVDDTPGEDDVSCGDHDAATCGDCDATAEDPSGCAGDCGWNEDTQTCEYPNVDCGDGLTAVSCGECPSEGGAGGCAGECMWDSYLNTCVPDDPSVDDVNCGDHEAASCGDCSAGLLHQSGCSGDCEWNDELGACISPPGDGDCPSLCYECDYKPPPVDCGDHEANGCRECPHGKGASGCAGECMWDSSANLCIEDDPSDPDINCGDHDATSCGDCDAGKYDTSGCDGQCAWSDELGACVKKPPVDCGEGRMEGSCGECVEDGLPTGCHGDCVWKQSIEQCVDKPPPPNDTVECGDHQSLICGECGVFDQNSIPVGNYYSGDYVGATHNGPKNHEILSADVDPNDSGIVTFTKNRGNAFVGAGMVSVKIYTDGDNQHFIKPIKIDDAAIDAKYCPSGRTVYPIHIKSMRQGCKTPMTWHEGQITVLGPNEFVLMSGKQYFYRRPTETELSLYMKPSPYNCQG